MLHGLDAPALLLLPVLWSLAGARAGQLDFVRSSAAMARTALTALCLCATALAVDTVLLVQVLADLGWFLGRHKTWLHVAVPVLPAAAVCGWTLPRLLAVRRAATRSEPESVALHRQASDPLLVVSPKAAALCATVNLYFAAVPHEHVTLGVLAVPLALVITVLAVLVATQLRRRRPLHDHADLQRHRRTTGRLIRIAAGAGVALVMLATLAVAAMTTSTATGHVETDGPLVRALVERTTVRTGTVTTEGADLYFEVRGSGPPLLMISGGGGDAAFFTYPAALLADEFQVITYDRRGNSRSTGNTTDLDVRQQARDAVAVIRAAGHRSAAVFGNSAGAIIALEMASSFPESVTAVIAHEPPILTIHPHRKWLAMFDSIARVSRTLGNGAAMAMFSVAVGIPFSAFGSVPDDFSTRTAANQEFFVEREMLAVVGYTPDVAALKASNVPIVMAIGATTRATDRFYGPPAAILAERIDAPLVVFPGHHLSYFDLPRPWTETLRDTLHTATSTPRR